MNIALDVDDILLDFQRHSHEWAEYLTGRQCPIQTEHYKLDRRYDLSIEEAKNLWESITWHDLPACKGAIEILNQSLDNGIVYFVTAINSENRHKRIENLSQTFGLSDTFIDQHLYTVGHGKNKREILDHLNIDLFIDDHLPNLLQANNGKRKLHFVDTGIRIYQESPHHSQDYHNFLKTMENKPYFCQYNGLSHLINNLESVFKPPKKVAVSTFKKSL